MSPAILVAMTHTWQELWKEGLPGLILCRHSLSWWSAMHEELKAAGHIASAVRKQQDGHRYSAHFLLLTKSKTPPMFKMGLHLN